MSVCIESALVDEHFEGKISPERESRLRAHLAGCDSCSSYYERRVLFAKLDPSALSLEDRLAIGLGLPRAPAESEPGESTTAKGEPPAPSPRRKVLVMAVTLFAAAAVLLLWFFGKKPADDGIASRGKHDSSVPYVRVYQSTKGGVPEPLTGPVHRTSELAFAYESTPDYDKLMIFGLDEHGHVYWYYPAWTDPSMNPASVTLATNPDLHPLREAVAHDLDGRTLEVHALFSHESRTVLQIESALAGKKAPQGPLRFPDSLDVVTQVEVLP